MKPRETGGCVAILCPAGIGRTPYLRYYMDTLSRAGLQYETFVWERGRSESKGTGSLHSYYRWDGGNMLSRAIGYSSYRRFLLDSICWDKYDGFIVLGAQVGVLLWQKLTSRKYIFDVRDRTHEGFGWYAHLEHKLLKGAQLVCISSDGFREWLPRDIQYIFSPNTGFERADVGDSTGKADVDRSNCVISYIGLPEDDRPHIRLAAYVGAMRGLELRYVGEGWPGSKTARFCARQHYSNISFYGTFNPDDKARWMKETTFVLGRLAGDKGSHSLLPNRLYDAAEWSRPFLALTESFQGNVTVEKGLGCVLDLNHLDGLKEQLVSFCETEQWNRYQACCNRFLTETQSQVMVWREAVGSVLRSW